MLSISRDTVHSTISHNKMTIIHNKIKRFFHILGDILEGEYKSLFKAGVLLIGICLITLSQIFPKLIELDYKTREIQFEIEAQEKNTAIRDINCDQLNQNISKCKLAQYQINTNYLNNYLAGFIVVASCLFGSFLILLSFFGYWCILIKRNNSKQIAQMK